MKYISILFTILLVWIAILAIASIRDGESSFQLFLTTIVFTLIIFFIGFIKK